MGVVYSIVCKTCRKWRDLDKLDRPYGVMDHYGAVSYAYKISDKTYIPALLVSFMADHMGHDCTLIDDYHNEFDGMTDGYEQDKGFWEGEDED